MVRWDIVREEYKQLHHSDGTVDMKSFRSEVAVLTRAFLDTDSAWDVFEQIQIDDTPTNSFIPATILDCGEFDSETYTFPPSSLTDDVQIEGIVVRSDECNRRVKLFVSDSRR